MTKDVNVRREKLLERVATGTEAAAFLNTNVGKYLLGKAIEDEYRAQLTLSNLDPTDTKAIIQAQIDARVPGGIMKWLNDAINAMSSAEFELRQEDVEKVGY